MTSIPRIMSLSHACHAELLSLNQSCQRWHVHNRSSQSDDCMMWWTNHGVTCKNVFLLNYHSHSYLTKSLRLIRSMPYETINPFTHTTTICAIYQQSKYLTPPDLGTTLCRCIDILMVRLKGIKGGAPLWK